MKQTPLNANDSVMTAMFPAEQIVWCKLSNLSNRAEYVSQMVHWARHVERLNAMEFLGI